MTSLTDPAEALARFAAEHEFADLPETVVDVAKQACVDRIAGALAGDKPLGGREFWDLMASIEEIDDIREIAVCWEAIQIGTA